jgi:hypothetical protein
MRDLLAKQGQHLLGRGWNARLRLNGCEQGHNLAGPLGGDHTEFGGVAPQCVDQTGALAEQGLAHLQHQAIRLLRF